MSSRQTFSRRDFLGKTLLTGASVAIAGRLSWPELADAQGTVPGKEKLIVRSLRFYDLETPVNLLDSFITPVNLFSCAITCRSRPSSMPIPTS